MFGNIKNIIIVASVSISLASVGASAWLYKKSNDEISRLTNENSTLSVALDTTNESLDELQGEYDRVQESLRQLQNDFIESRRQGQLLEDRFEGHDIGRMAERYPGLIQNIINGGTEDAFRCFEIMSGSPLTEEERNATNGNEFNKECPWLFGDADAR